MSLAKLDRIDINILAHLQQFGRITNIELAEAVSLSASPCLVRVKRLEKEGYLTSYNAHVDISKLIETRTILTEVTLEKQRQSDFARFEQKIASVEEVMECHLISGGYDYLLKFLTTGVSHYQRVIEAILAGDFGVDKYFSYIVIKSPVEKPFVPLKSLIDKGRT
ncbi:MAG TPA: Lrp/AsnC family transcriptional regulator [Woeseiaceae bacterium]|nr:Lrp/AsnC family transcriptional regulator [Woeseiaceae bacterium]